MPENPPSNGNVLPLKHQNSFTLIRLILALMVVFGHTYALGGFGAEPLERWTSGRLSGRELAVYCFFVLSGYLLCHSLAIHDSLSRFAIRRACRILPGFWTCLAVMVFIVTPVYFWIFYPDSLSYLEIITYGHKNALRFAAINGSFWGQQGAIVGLFPKNPVWNYANGSLWSIRWEAYCYIVLGIAAFGKAQKHRGFLSCLFALQYGAYLCVAYPELAKHAGVLSPIAQFFTWESYWATIEGALLCFTAGVALQTFSRGARLWNPWVFTVTSIFFGVSIPSQLVLVVWPLTVPYLLISLGQRLPFSGFERYGDFSYGVYLYSFLIQQCLIAFGVHKLGFLSLLVLSVILSLIAGAISWFLIERPAIAWGSRLIRSIPVSRPEHVVALAE